jgi:hypothetical protein
MDKSDFEVISALGRDRQLSQGLATLRIGQVSRDVQGQDVRRAIEDAQWGAAPVTVG